MHLRLVQAASFLLAVVPTVAHAQVGESDRRPNVLVVVADDVSDRDMAFLPTPRFDALAAEGVRFRRAYAHPVCSQSRWALHFGQYQRIDAGTPCEGYSKNAPDTSLPSLPKLFAGAGYRTALFGKWHLGSHPEVASGAPWELAPTLHGYETWRAGMSSNASQCGGRDYSRWLRVDDGVSRMTTAYNTHAIRDAFLAWLGEADQDAESPAAPWFAMVCFQAPHSPFHVPPGMSGGKRSGAPLQPRKQYEWMVQDLDASFGAILDAIDRERTVVLFAGDNGTPPKVVGPRQKKKRVKKTTYEEGIRIPMVWAGPGIARGVESHALVHLVDVLPSAAEILGTRIDAELDGASLVPALQDPSRSVHDFVWSGSGTRAKGDFAVVTPSHKYRAAGGASFLFDLTQDPYEMTNLSGREEFAELEARLRSLLFKHTP